MPELNQRNLRQYKRIRPDTRFKVNDGKPYMGGLLYDVSAGGATVSYPKETESTTSPIKVGQILTLIVADCIEYRITIVRISQAGFACKFRS